MTCPPLWVASTFVSSLAAHIWPSSLSRTLCRPRGVCLQACLWSCLPFSFPPCLLLCLSLSPIFSLWNIVSTFLVLCTWSGILYPPFWVCRPLYPGLFPVLSLNLSLILSSSWSGMLSPLACLRSYLLLVCDAGVRLRG